MDYTVYIGLVALAIVIWLTIDDDFDHTIKFINKFRKK